MNTQKNYFILIGILGTAFEWLEYSYYGYLTTKIGLLFFPNYDIRTGLMATMGIFAAGFIMRPIGGLLFGYIGDKKGRKRALFISLLLMGCSSLLIGSLPTYQTIGIYAPLLLLLCRLIQGLAVAGEFNGAAIYLIEHSNNKHPTLAGSWVGMASALGMVLGAFAAIIVSASTMPGWAWRVPFFLAFASCFIANYLRYKLFESPVFINAFQQQQLVSFPLKKVLTHYRQSFITNIILAAFVSIYIYVCNVYFVSYLIKDIHLPMRQAAFLAVLGECIVVLTFPLVALLADRIGYKIIMTIGLLGSLITTPLLFIAPHYSIASIIYAEILFGLTNALACAPIFNFIYKLFPTGIRYTGNSTAWSLGAALFGGTAPLLADYLMQTYSFYGPWLLVAIFALLSLLLILNNIFIEARSNNDAIVEV